LPRLGGAGLGYRGSSGSSSASWQAAAAAAEVVRDRHPPGPALGASPAAA